MFSKDRLGMAFAGEMIVILCGKQLAQEQSLTFTLQ